MSDDSKEKKKKEYQTAYVKRYNLARNLATRELILLHKDEYDILLAGEKIKVGILPRGLSDVYDRVLVRKAY